MDLCNQSSLTGHLAWQELKIQDIMRKLFKPFLLYLSCRAGKHARGVLQGGVIWPALFIVLMYDFCDQLATNDPRVFLADNLALLTRADKWPPEPSGRQKPWTSSQAGPQSDEWLVIINRAETEDTWFSFSHERGVHLARRSTKRNPPPRHPSVPGSKVWQKAYIVSSHQ